MLCLCSDHYKAQTHVQPRTGIRAKTTSEEVCWAIISLSCAQKSRSLLSTSWDHAKPPSASITPDAANPSPELQSILWPECMGGSHMPGTSGVRGAASCITPSAPPHFSCSPCQNCGPSASWRAVGQRGWTSCQA